MHVDASSVRPKHRVSYVTLGGLTARRQHFQSPKAQRRTGKHPPPYQAVLRGGMWGAAVLQVQVRVPLYHQVKKGLLLWKLCVYDSLLAFCGALAVSTITGGSCTSWRGVLPSLRAWLRFRIWGRKVQIKALKEQRSEGT